MTTPTSTLDLFFRANYRRMVNYCLSFWSSREDVEETVADVILHHHDSYKARITTSLQPEQTLRRWLNRRALLNLRSRSYHSKVALDNLPEHLLPATLDTPESILDLKQRLPPLHPIFFTYAPYSKATSARGSDPLVSDKLSIRARGANTPTDRHTFCTAKKRFLEQLHAQP